MQPPGEARPAMRQIRSAALAAALASGALAGCATPPEPTLTVTHSTTPRSIALRHVESGEMISVTYWNGQSYDPAALDAVTTLFRDRRTQETMPVDPALLDYLADLRDAVGLPPESPVELTSCYRSPFTNASLARSNPNVAENSYHLRAAAADFHFAGVPLERVAAAAAAMQRGGYALYASHIHVDTGPFRTWTPRGGAGAWLVARLQSHQRQAAARTMLAQSKTPGKPGAAKVQVAQTQVPVKPKDKPAHSGAKPATKASQPTAKPAGGKQTSVKVAAAKPAPPKVRVVVAQLSTRDNRAAKATR